MTAVPETSDVKHLIGGDWRPASDGATFETRDPHDDSLLGNVARGTAADGADAITAAREAFDEGPWPRMSPKERAKILHAVADKVDEHREELSLLETRDGGKGINQAQHAEIPRVAHNLRFFADYVAMAANEAYPDGDLLSYTLYPPAGVVSAISPWNAPLMLATWKIAPALAFGNTTVLKPAPQTPLTANRFAQLALEAGLPEGVLNVVHGFGGEAVAGPLTSDPRVDRITFTGSSATGVRILQAAAPNHTPCPRKWAVSPRTSSSRTPTSTWLCRCRFGRSSAETGRCACPGRVCWYRIRLWASSSTGSPTRRRNSPWATRRTRRTSSAPSSSRSTSKGPQLRRAGRVRRRKDPHRRFASHRRRSRQGVLLPPTVIAGLTNDSRTAREEIFGPVETVLGFDTEDEALRIANDSPYGLAGILFTDNLNRAHRMAARWKAGTVWINTFFERDLRLPFGGEGSSGLGREGGQYSREFFTEPRAVTIRLRS